MDNTTPAAPSPPDGPRGVARQTLSGDPSLGGVPLNSVGASILLEDYKLWQRELEKQDRWFSQSIWTVLAGASAGLLLIRSLPLPERAVAECAIVGVAGLFVSMSADFLVGRVRSYLMVARHVAAVRAVTGSRAMLGLSQRFATPGAPLLSDSPEAFTRTCVAGARSPFRSLYGMHWVVLTLLYVMLGFGLQYDLNSLLWTTISAGFAAVHLLSFSLLFKWRASEAETVGEFIVTLARDRGIGVARDGEARLLGWIERFRRNRSVVVEAAAVVPVLIEWEDRRYRRHSGIDWVSVVSVLVRKRRRGGATTIPMQLARQLIARPHGRSRLRSIKRKLYEAFLARWLIRTAGHETVLAAWLELIPFGCATVVGIRAAAHEYFGKTIDDLDVIDGVLLAERISISSGRFDPGRIERVIGWAVTSGLIPEGRRTEALQRAESMRKRTVKTDNP